MQAPPLVEVFSLTTTEGEIDWEDGGRVAWLVMRSMRSRKTHSYKIDGFAGW